MSKMPQQFKLDKKIDLMKVVLDNNFSRSSHNVYRDYIDSEHESLVDTCFVVDTQYWETAVCMPLGVIVVSEYQDEDTAKEEHVKWASWAKAASKEELSNLKDIHFD